MKQSEIYRKCHELLGILKNEQEFKRLESISLATNTDYIPPDHTKNGLCKLLNVSIEDFEQIVVTLEKRIKQDHGTFKEANDGFESWRKNTYLKLALDEEIKELTHKLNAQTFELNTSTLSLNKKIEASNEIQARISKRMFCITVISACIAGLTAFFIWQQNNFIEADGIESKLRLQEMKKNRQGIYLINTKLDSLSHGVLDVRILKHDSMPHP